MFAALIATILGLAYYRPQQSCVGYFICDPAPASRGFPLPVIPVDDPVGYGDDEIANWTILLFLTNFSIYFIVFGSAYFAYTKLFKKTKKK